MLHLSDRQVSNLFAPPDLHQTYLPMMKSGFKEMTQGLLSETYLEAHVS